jgi:hypothetical protein
MLFIECFALSIFQLCVGEYYIGGLFGFRLVAGIFRLLLYNSLKSKVLGKIEFN